MAPTGWLIGAVLGVRHALEPDHLLAIGTLVAETPRRAVRGMSLGALWGIGHTAALVVVTGLLGALGARLPEQLSTAFELAVAAMLVLLGLRAVRRGLRPSPSTATLAESRAPGPRAAFGSWRPFCVGVIHGLAGSGALAVLTLVSLPTTLERFLYTLVFGVGSMLGMSALAGGASLLPVGSRSGSRALARLPLVAGGLSVLMGLFWLNQIVRGRIP